MDQQQQQQQALYEARTRYLEQSCLREAAEDLVYQIQHLILEDVPVGETISSEQADIKLRQAGLHVPAAAAQSLYTHLQAAYAVQRLQLPTAGQQVLQGSTAADSGNADTDDHDQVGSKHHVLGVTPQQLRKTHMLNKKAAKKAHAPVLPLLEQHLDRQAQQAVAAVAGPSAGPDAAAHVTSSIQHKQSSVPQQQKECTELLVAVVQSYQAYTQDLHCMQQVLTQLLQDCILTEQPALDKKHREWLDARITNMCCKLAHMQLQVREQTYDARNVAALNVIRQELQDTQQRLTDAVEAMTMQLQDYAALGEDFRRIAQDYGAVKAETVRLEGILETLTRVENEGTFY